MYLWVPMGTYGYLWVPMVDVLCLISLVACLFVFRRRQHLRYDLGLNQKPENAPNGVKAGLRVAPPPVFIDVSENVCFISLVANLFVFSRGRRHSGSNFQNKLARGRFKTRYVLVLVGGRCADGRFKTRYVLVVVGG